MEVVEKLSTTELFQNLQKKITWQHRSFVKRAFLIAQEAHRYQQRKSGEPYIIHPLSVALILTEYSSDPEVISAALLHDVLEDSDISNDTIINTFGERVYHLVEGVTKINQLKNQSKVESQASNLVKLVMAYSKDQRIILIKIADRLHNMRTLGSLPMEKQKRIANETIKIFAPIAGRVGIYKIKSELEDLCLRYLDNDEYIRIKNWVDQKKEDRENYIEQIKKEVESHLKSYKIKSKIEGRSKHFYSIYRKLHEKGRSFNEIFDLYAIRIITRDVSDCFTALGVIHSVYNHIPGRFKDYINHQKKNGYQSIHTTVNGPDNINIEVQIRTYEMHQIAEYGIAAHWKYKEKIKSFKNNHSSIEIPGRAVLSNTEIEKSDNTEDIYLEIVEDLQEKEDVYVFTPGGDLHVFPRNSTVLDFAFRIHTDLGIHCAGAKINERLVSIRTYLRNGDKIQIITNPATKPTNDWLRFVITSHAKNRIRNWLRKNTQNYYPFPVKENLSQPKNKKETQNLDKIEKNYKKRDKEITKNDDAQVKKKSNYDEKTNLLDLIEWEGIREVKKRIPKCCHPEYGKPIIGYITRGDGITVHDENCRIAQKLREDPQKSSLFIDLTWVGFSGFITELVIYGKDRGHLYYDIIRSFDYFGVDIKNAEAVTRNNQIMDKFKLEVDSKEQLDNIVKTLESIEGIEKVDIQCFRKKRCNE